MADRFDDSVLLQSRCRLSENQSTGQEPDSSLPKSEKRFIQRRKGTKD